MDKHIYNNGDCKKCGGNMRCFGIDTQGTFGYTCDKCGNNFWISWYKPKDN